MPESDYEAALAKRIDALGTRHSYGWAKKACSDLLEVLHFRIGEQIHSIGIGLTEDRRDVTLVVRAADQCIADAIPKTFQGLTVETVVSAGPEAY